MFKSLVSTLLISVALVGCANQRFNVAGEGSGTSPKLEDRQTFFISGLGQKQTIDAAKICGGAGKVDTVDVEHTFMDGVLGFFSLGIYTPRTARVYCKA